MSKHLHAFQRSVTISIPTCFAVLSLAAVWRLAERDSTELAKFMFGRQRFSQGVDPSTALTNVSLDLRRAYFAHFVSWHQGSVSHISPYYRHHAFFFVYIPEPWNDLQSFIFI